MPLTAGARFGPYEIVAPVGSGGMGEVYRATDTRLKRVVAIKVLPESVAFDSERLARFQREAEVLASLNHPNIAHVYGLEQGDGTTGQAGARALVMEFVEGPTLAEQIAQGPLPLAQALRIATQMAEALDAAHEQGIVHRDLKPANVKVRSDGTVKVLDFGLAKAIESPPVAASRAASLSPTMTTPAATMQGVLLGTAAYMSPEQARGEPVDKRADIWAFGVVLHEMLTGRRLFEGKTVSDTLAAVLVKDADISDAPREVQPLLAACVERDVKRRLRDVGDVRRLLDEGRRSAATQMQTRVSRTPWVIAALLAVAALGAGWTAWRARQPQDRPLVQLPIDLGADAGLSPFPISDIALSPDNRHLAFVNFGGGNRPPSGRGGTPSLPDSRISIRRLDEDAVVQLAGTENATTVFFSPDSQWLAFYARGRLNKISVTGGAVISLADLSSFQGASWIDQTSIIVAGSTAGSSTGEIALWRISASGGSSKPTRVAPLSNRNLITQILPGGRHALAVGYDSVRVGLGPGNNDQATVEAVSLIDGTRTPIVQGGFSPLYLPSGHLIYLTRGTLFAVRFDPETLQTRGAAVPIVKDVQFNAGSGRATLSFSDAGTLVYRSGAPTSSLAVRARVELVDASGARTTVATPPRGFQRPRFSPDGTKLAVLIDEAESRDEWVLDLARVNLTRITFGGIPITTAAWSADGTHVMVGSGGDGIHAARADGAGQPQLLAKLDGLLFLGNYSPQAKRLTYFLANRQSAVVTIPVSDEEGRFQAGNPEVVLQSRFQNVHPELSPDGRWIAYATDESGRYEVSVRPFPISASGPGNRVPISSGGGDYPRWSPTGSELLYESDGRIQSVRYRAEASTFVLVGEPRVRVEKLPIIGGAWDVARDGRIVLLAPVEEQQAPLVQPTVMYVENFFDELRRRVPVD